MVYYVIIPYTEPIILIFATPDQLEDTCGKNGPYRPPKWSQARSSGRPCLAPDPPEVVELENKIPSSFGGENPLQVSRLCFGFGFWVWGWLFGFSMRN